MTGQEWEGCTDPQAMLDFIGGRATDRKLRLFAAACCRCVWHLVDDERNRKVIEVAELHADGQVEVGTLMRTLKPMPMPEWPGGGPEIFDWKLVTTGIAADMTAPRTYVWMTAETSVPELTAGLAARTWAEDGLALVPGETQAALLRCLFANPLHPPPAIDPGWLAWNGGVVFALARTIYVERRFEDMLILADALEEAGCDNADILGHLRGPGSHARACHAVDAILEQRTGR